MPRRRANTPTPAEVSQAQADEGLEALFMQANQLLGENADNLRGQALLASEHRKDREAMRVLSFVWGRSSHHMATAALRFPGEFQPLDGRPAQAQTTDEVLALFELSKLPDEQAQVLYHSFRQLGLKAWQVRDRVDVIRKTDSECIRSNFKNARIVGVSQDGVVRIKLSDPGEAQRLRQFMPDVRMDMLLLQLPNKPGWAGGGDE